VASVNTGNERRDGHLRSADWFEADRHPYMTFKSTSVKANGDGGLLAHGLLTIKGQSHEVALPIKLLGRQPIPLQPCSTRAARIPSVTKETAHGIPQEEDSHRARPDLWLSGQDRSGGSVGRAQRADATVGPEPAGRHRDGR